MRGSVTVRPVKGARDRSRWLICQDYIEDLAQILEGVVAGELFWLCSIKWSTKKTCGAEVFSGTCSQPALDRAIMPSAGFWKITELGHTA